MSAGIYLIKNMVNGKVYVGSTNNLNNRKQQHFWLLRNQKHKNSYLQSSFDKYGEKNFTYYIICHCLEEDLIKKEDFFIRYLHAMDRKCGYNLKEAERCCPSEKTKLKISLSVKRARQSKNWYCSEETKRRISKSVSKVMIGVPKSKEHRKSLSKALKGSNSPNYGRPMSKRNKAKISVGVKEYWRLKRDNKK